MKARYISLIVTAMAVTMSSAAVAQSRTLAGETKLSQAPSGSPQTPTQPGSNPANTQAPARQSAPPTQSQPQSPAQQQAPKAQVSQEELQKFANAVKKLQPIQQNALSQITTAIKQQNLSEKRFGEIYQSKQNPQAQPTAKVTPEESKKFEQVNAKITQIQKSTQSKMEQTVKSEGLEIPRFNQIFLAIRQDPQLLQKVRQMLRS
ncbi:MAG TPA: hypothetical protein DEV81_09575 [Cyanobacteria bacterium UBA11049]|nr:hypothetical protein [Cyanobacteria bacterium UBA11049]